MLALRKTSSHFITRANVNGVLSEIEDKIPTDFVQQELY